MLAKFFSVALLCIGFSLCTAQTSNEPNNTAVVDIEQAGLKIFYTTVSTDSGATALSIKAVYQGLAWLSVGINPDGVMIGGQTVIGQPNVAISSENPGKYSLTDKAASGIVLMGSSSQTLINASITQDTSAGTTTLTYIKIVEESGEHSIDPSGNNTFIYAIGSDNNFPNYHGARGTIVLDLSGATAAVVEPQQSTKNYTKIFAAHGIMAVIAWAFLTPFAIGSAFLRSLSPTPLWFKLHMYLNSISFILTATAFGLALANIGRAQWFSKAHFKAGWVIMGFATIQVLAGIFRPHPEKGEKPKTVKEVVVRNLNGVKIGSIRAIWEASHKLIGFATLALALWQMQSGIKLLKEKYGTKNYLVPYWIWIIVLFTCLLILKIFAFRKWSKISQEEDIELQEQAKPVGEDTELEESAKPAPQ